MQENKPTGLNRLWEYGIGVGLLGIAVWVLWGLVTSQIKDMSSRIDKLEINYEDCTKNNIEILTNQVQKSNVALDEFNQYFRQMPKYKRI